MFNSFNRTLCNSTNSTLHKNCVTDQTTLLASVVLYVAAPIVLALMFSLCYYQHWKKTRSNASEGVGRVAFNEWNVDTEIEQKVIQP